MKINQHGKSLYKLTRLWFVNCYLVVEEDGLTLIDTGMWGSANGILKAAASIGLPIRRITLTHAHADHAGSLAPLVKALPEAELLMSERTAAFLRGEMALYDREPQVKLRGSFVTLDIEPAHIIKEGDMLGSLRVLAAPGHAPDQVAFIDSRDGTLIAGDAFQTRGGIAVSGVLRPLFPFTALATWHLPTALESAGKLRALNPSRLAVGHGPVLEQPLEAMDGAIAVAQGVVNGQTQMA